MMKVNSVLIGLILSAYSFASDSNNNVSHRVTLTGLNSGEGRYIRSDVFENNQFQSGLFFCAGSNRLLYDMNYVLSKSHEPFHVEHLIKFSICQDETMAQCEEFATDKYSTFRNLAGYLHNDVSESTVDISPVKMIYQSCEPDVNMDELVKRSIHDNNRRFTRVG